jgi:hypothetical protein
VSPAKCGLDNPHFRVAKKLLHKEMIGILLATVVSSQCISLAQSRSCPELAAFSIAPQANGFSNVQEFDTYLERNVGWWYGNSCPRWPNAQSTRIRYSKSVICAVAVSTSARQCGAAQSPPALCKASVAMAFDDVRRQLTTVC